MRYRKRPEFVDALYFDGSESTGKAIQEWSRDELQTQWGDKAFFLYRRGDVHKQPVVTPGDFALRDALSRYGAESAAIFLSHHTLDIAIATGD